MDDARKNIELYLRGNCINDFYLVIENDGVIQGAIICVQLYRKTLDTSGIIFEPYRGKGVMTASLLIFIEWLKNNTDYSELLLSINQHNAVSIHQAKKCGAVLEEMLDDSLVYKIHLNK